MTDADKGTYLKLAVPSESLIHTWTIRIMRTGG